MNEGFITLHRKFKTWEWYTNVNVKTLFLHCLIRANWEDRKWQGIDISRGQFLTSIKTLSTETGLSERQVRTALDKLIKTNELTSKSTNRYRIITVTKYNDYQDSDKQDVSQMTVKRQASDKQVTTNKELKEVKPLKPLEQKYYDNPQLNELFLDFLKQRKKLKAVNSERAINGLLNKLNKYDDSIKIKMIDNAIIGSWKTVYELKDKDINNDNKEYLPPSSTYKGD